MSNHRILVTGANGNLGRLVIESLLETVPAQQIVASMRDPAQGESLLVRGVTVVAADYDKPETLKQAFVGIDKVLLVSSSALGHRVAQHRNVIEAAQVNGVKLIAYTSLLRADVSELKLAEEHRETEALIRASGIPYVLLRNGWYTENYAASIPAARQHNSLLGAAGAGRISSATRADYAAAAAAVLTATEDQAGRIYELAGDFGYTMAEFAEEVSRQAGVLVAYVNLPKSEYEAALLNAGLPQQYAELLANSDAAAATGALFDDNRTLSGLIGRPTTPFSETIAAALKA